MDEFEKEPTVEAEETVLSSEEIADAVPAAAEETAAPNEPIAASEVDPKSWLHTMYELMGNVAIALTLVTVLFSFCFRQVVVDGDSMNDTLTNRDRLLLQTMFYSIDRGDIVVIYQPDEPQKPLIKRVIAKGGDSLRLDVEKNEVHLKKAGEGDWELLSEPYVHYPLFRGIDDTVEGEENDTITVPEGAVFVLGDHRNNSRDSRMIGCIQEENVVGTVLLRVFPFSELGVV